MSHMIHWTAFDWPSFATLMGAFATLTAGTAAVVGAVTIGKAQVAITRRQADAADRQAPILESQTRLAELTLRHDLFDRRYAVYGATLDFLARRQGFVSQDVAEQRLRAFMSAAQQAKFLFNPRVYEELAKMHLHDIELLHKKREIDRYFATRGTVSDELIEERSSLESFLDSQFTRLPEIFSELQLSAI